MCQPFSGAARSGGKLTRVLQRGADIEVRRLSRGHPYLGKRRWDDPLQKQVDAATETEMPWYEFAKD